MYLNFVFIDEYNLSWSIASDLLLRASICRPACFFKALDVMKVEINITNLVIITRCDIVEISNIDVFYKNVIKLISQIKKRGDKETDLTISNPVSPSPNRSRADSQPSKNSICAISP